MKKYKASSIKREMPATPSPEKLLMKKLGYFPLLQQQEQSEGKEHLHIVPMVVIKLLCIQGGFFCHNCSEWDLQSALPARKVAEQPN
jgi:hypothetical protein